MRVGVRLTAIERRRVGVRLSSAYPTRSSSVILGRALAVPVGRRPTQVRAEE